MEVRLTLNLQIGSRHDEDNPIFFSLIPVAVRTIYDRYFIAFGERQLVGTSTRIIVQSFCFCYEKVSKEDRSDAGPLARLKGLNIGLREEPRLAVTDDSAIPPVASRL